MSRLGVTAIVRMTPAEALAHVDPDDERLDGVLYVPQVPDTPVTDDEVRAWLNRFGRMLYREELARRVLTHARVAVEGKARLISGGTLATEALAPFALDGVTYPSLRRFYDALKIPDGELRARFVAGEPRQALAVGRGRADGTFAYGGRTIAVGSLEHLQLIARAVSAKVDAHAAVRTELAATGTARLVMGNTHSQPLGRVVPFAYMIERLRRAH